MIPKILLQTSKNAQEQYVTELITNQLTDEWKYYHFTDLEIINFFKNNPLSQFPDIEDVFNSIERGEYKADLFRYYFLYINGGVFIDSDLHIVSSLDRYTQEYDFFTAQSIFENDYFQGILGVSPNNNIILEALSGAYHKFKNKTQIQFYTELCTDFKKIALNNQTEYKTKIFKEFVYNDKITIIKDCELNIHIGYHYVINGEIAKQTHDRVKMKLNVGAGDTRYPGYLNCDYDNKFNPDYTFDIEKDVWPFEDNSVSDVIIHHVLEHMGDGYFHVLQELYRVCKPSALIDIKVPHYRHHCFFHDPTHRRPITPYGLTLFSKEYNEQDKGASSKLGYFFDVDFKILSSKNVLDPYHPNIDQLLKMTEKELDIYAHEKNNIFCETHIELMVVKGDREQQIRGFYLNLLNREADTAGLHNYLEGNLSIADIKNIIINSDEYKRLVY